MATTKTKPTARVIKDAAAESKAKVDAAMARKAAADQAAKAAATRPNVTAPTTPQSVKTSQIADAAAASKAKADALMAAADAAAASKAKADALMAAKSAANADAQSKMIANPVNRVAPAPRVPVTSNAPSTYVRPNPTGGMPQVADGLKPATGGMPQVADGLKPATGGMPQVADGLKPATGGMGQAPAFKRGGKVRKEKEVSSQPAKKNNAVRGWGMARGARKAKIV